LHEKKEKIADFFFLFMQIKYNRIYTKIKDDL